MLPVPLGPQPVRELQIPVHPSLPFQRHVKPVIVLGAGKKTLSKADTVLCPVYWGQLMLSKWSHKYILVSCDTGQEGNIECYIWAWSQGELPGGSNIEPAPK